MEKVKVAEAAALLKVHPGTVRRYTERGILQGKRNYLNHRIFSVEEVMRLKSKLEALDGRWQERKK